MTKSLFIAPYRQADGWGNAAKEYAKSIAKSCELAIRPIYMGSSFCELDEDLLEYEFNDFREYDTIIQNCLPHFSHYHGGCKNVLLCHLETSSLEHTSWLGHMKLMDEVWVPSTANRLSLLESGMNPDKVKVVPIPCDIEKYKKDYGKLHIPHVNHDDFVFYFVGEYVQRKNLTALITAFHCEFEPYEQVKLVIKTNKTGYNPQQLSQEINKKILNTKSRLRIFPNTESYKQDIVITDMLPEDHLMAMHNTCDCFVMPSHGESWSMPTFDAMAMGNPCIVPSNTGMTEYVNKENGWIVESTSQPCMTRDAPLSDIYTARERWRHVSVSNMMSSMREAFEDKKKLQRKSKKCVESSVQYSYKQVANTIKELLK